MGSDAAPGAEPGLLQRWETVRRRLPAINLVFKGHPLHAILTDLPASLIPTGFLFSLAGSLRREPALESAGFACTAADHRGWRVKPVEREEIEQQHLPPTVHEDDFILRRRAR
jgi:hypothetical protein